MSDKRQKIRLRQAFGEETRSEAPQALGPRAETPTAKRMNERPANNDEQLMEAVCERVNCLLALRMPDRHKASDAAQQRGELSGQVAAQDQQMHQKPPASAAVGIIFLRGNNLCIDSTPLNNAVHYGALKTHEKGHQDYWEELQRRGLVSIDVEYDEVPRGRCTADSRRGSFLLL